MSPGFRIAESADPAEVVQGGADAAELPVDDGQEFRLSRVEQVRPLEIAVIDGDARVVRDVLEEELLHARLECQ
ncbi:hypothetical protein [Candidatus Amarobacter glycogenicus]|uniref:hypothetical protein n=1 Tax=Candidatus Amarobacter glycogenicus TaxID=3140699 RepID=UPI0031CCAC82